LPEATGGEILNDIADFWQWVTSPALLDAISSRWPNLSLNNTYIAVTGESAGGYLALQSAFLFQDEAKHSISVVMAQYPSMHPDTLDPYLTDHGDPFANVPENPESILNDYIESLPPGAIRLSSPFPQNSEVAFSLRTSKRRPALMSDERLRLGYSLDFAKKVPPIWILQGTDDTIVSLTIVISATAEQKLTFFSP
jgi:acetyl esterase/lipase